MKPHHNNERIASIGNKKRYAAGAHATVYFVTDNADESSSIPYAKRYACG